MQNILFFPTGPVPVGSERTVWLEVVVVVEPPSTETGSVGPELYVSSALPTECLAPAEWTGKHAGRRSGRTLPLAFLKGGLGVGQIRRAEFRVDRHGTLGVAAAFGAASLPRQGLGQTGAVRRVRANAPLPRTH